MSSQVYLYSPVLHTVQSKRAAYSFSIFEPEKTARCSKPLQILMCVWKRQTPVTFRSSGKPAEKQTAVCPDCGKVHRHVR